MIYKSSRARIEPNWLPFFARCLRPIQFAMLALVLSAITARPVSATDLEKVYPAKLDVSKQPRGYAWTTDKSDVWKLKHFTISYGDGFKIELGPSQVVFGCNGTSVLWAVVFPDEPGEITQASAGKGEKVTSIWLRFHPARVGELFPEATVIGQGDAAMIDPAKEVAEFKLSASYHVGPRAMIPPRNHTIVDCETKAGARRFYLIDSEKQTVQYVDAFRTRTLPVPTPLEEQAAAEIFDKVWNEFDREYAMFAVKPQVDWAALRETYHPRAAAATDNRALARILSDMLSHLEDLHVYVRVDGRYLTGFSRKRHLNASPAAIQRLVGPLRQGPADRRSNNLDWTVTKDGIGYVRVTGLQDKKLPERFESALQEMKDTRGLILDLRFNGGGAEPLAQQIAGCFLDRERVYAMSQYRDGPAHDDLTKKFPRTLAPNPRWYYTGPVVVLQGQRTMSSAEAFVLMLAKCSNVTTMGDRTAGSSGNPRQVDAGAGIVVNLPRWIPEDADGKSFDTTGVPPDVPIETTDQDFTRTADPVLSAALERLKKVKPEDAPVLKNR